MSSLKDNGRAGPPKTARRGKNSHAASPGTLTPEINLPRCLGPRSKGRKKCAVTLDMRTRTGSGSVVHTVQPTPPALLMGFERQNVFSWDWGNNSLGVGNMILEMVRVSHARLVCPADSTRYICHYVMFTGLNLHSSLVTARSMHTHETESLHVPPSEQ